MDLIFQQLYWNAAFVFLAGTLTRITLALMACYCVARMLPRHAALRHAVLIAGLLSVLAMPFLGSSLFRVASPRFSFSLPRVHLAVDSPESVELSSQVVPVHESRNSPAIDVIEISDKSSTEVNADRWGYGFWLLVATWATVSGVRTIGLSRSFIRLRRLVNHAAEANSPQLQLIIAEFRRRFRFQRSIEVLTSANVTSPLSVGLVRNCVVLPPGLTSLSNTALKAVMFHELAHLQRRDHIVVILQELMGILLWWHPLALLVNRELTLAREEVCDNYVLQAADSETYSEALLIVSRLLYPPTETVGATPLWGVRWNLERRISSILDERRIVMTSLNLRTSAVVTTLCLGISLLLATSGFSHDAEDGKHRFEGNRDVSDSVLRVKDWSLENAKVTDAGLKYLAEFKNLQNLNLNGTNITDQGLAHLKKLTNLKSLALSGTKVTSVGLANLKNLHNLKELYLYDTNVTDDGLANLESLTNLTILNLARTKITDVGLERLQQMKKLENLFLGFTGVTDAGLPNLSGMKDLKGLYLVRTDVSDQGLNHIKGLTNLETLWLSYTHATDAGLVHLKELTKLKEVNLSGTRITDRGLRHFSGLDNLETLHITLTRTGPDGLGHLGGLHKLQSLYMVHTAVGEEAVTRLKQKLPNLTVHGPGA